MAHRNGHFYSPAALDSKLILNLNEPCKLEDTSWIHPTKYMAYGGR